ncbi:mediator of RNA polymerase II transcription subunit [Striga asiatica]|uniref:Mediator of RNA polymerase II transcription subunit n=1 Tax=Striga asiatica TaxID=4170 RepID=A0A5A7P1P0_STRAF|nr:mediator of RNA polymerase II transcription subunit [Striga asiatica]
MGPSLRDLCMGCPWPSLPVISSLWSDFFFFFSASQTVFHHFPDSIVQLLHACFSSSGVGPRLGICQLSSSRSSWHTLPPSPPRPRREEREFHNRASDPSPHANYSRKSEIGTDTSVVVFVGWKRARAGVVLGILAGIKEVMTWHMEFVAGVLDGRILLGCDGMTWREYVTGYLRLMMGCAPEWVAEVDVEVLKSVGPGLRRWGEEEMGSKLLGLGGIRAMGAAAEMIIEKWDLILNNYLLV